MILCEMCNKMSGYPVKDGGTVFCLECLHVIKRKPTCKGTCTLRCLICTKSKEQLSELAQYIKSYNKI